MRIVLILVLIACASCIAQEIPVEEQPSSAYKPTPQKPQHSLTQNGFASDSIGAPGIDPTENVKALSEALSRRQDDLRDLNNRYLDARINAVKEVAILRAEHSKELRGLEADRLKSIREVDVQNTAITAAQQLAAIQTLAATAASNADALRAAVATTATAIQNQTDRIVSGIVDRIAILEKSSYTGAGRQAISDPQTEKLNVLVEKLSAAQSQGTGKSAGIDSTIAMIVSGAFLVIAVLTVWLRSQHKT